jgi:uncharacterized membrane protein
MIKRRALFDWPVFSLIAVALGTGAISVCLNWIMLGKFSLRHSEYSATGTPFQFWLIMAILLAFGLYLLLFPFLKVSTNEKDI